MSFPGVLYWDYGCGLSLKSSKLSKQPLVRHALRPRSLSGIRGLLQCGSISSCKSSCPLSGVTCKRCPLFGGSGCISYIGRSVGAKARRPLGGGVPYL
jgi:hypothetical protein